MRRKLLTALSMALLTSGLYAEPCNVCQGGQDNGKIKKLVLENDTGDGHDITVFDTDGNKLYDNYVSDGDTFKFKGDGDHRALGDEIYICIDGDYYTTIETGCSHVDKGEDVDSFKVKRLTTTPCDDNADNGDNGDNGDDYDKGLDEGYDPGFDEGKGDACNNRPYHIDEDFSDDSDYDKGWAKGYTKGYDEGWASCDNPTPPEDTSSYDDGWDAGFDPGTEEGKSDVCEGRPYHIDEDFSDDTKYDRGWAKGYSKGYDYAYKQGCPTEGNDNGDDNIDLSSCQPCRGGITSMTFKNTSDDDKSVEIDTKKGGTIFDEAVDAGDTFTVKASDSGSRKGKSGKKGNKFDNDMYINGSYLHTSCSKPIGVGMKFGELELIKGYSAEGGLLCSIDDYGNKGKSGKKGKKGKSGKKGKK